MRKNDIVENVASTVGLTKADAAKAVDAVFENIANALRDGEEVRLVGFGTFDVVHRAASKGRNPRTGEEIDIAPSRRPRFRAGKSLKDVVEGK